MRISAIQKITLLLSLVIGILGCNVDVAVAAPCASTITADCTVSGDLTDTSYDWRGGNVTVTGGTQSGFDNSGSTVGDLTINSGVTDTYGGTLVTTAGPTGTITNNGTLNGDGVIDIRDTATAIINTGIISSTGGNSAAIQVYSTGSLNLLQNTSTGHIESDDLVLNVDSGGQIGTIDNSGRMNSTTQEAIVNHGTITTITNSGTIEGGAPGNSASGIYNDYLITTITNSGTIKGNDGGYGISNDGAGTITTITNTGTIVGDGGGYGIYNNPSTGAVITTLNNLQGVGNSSGALTYTGKLPANYNIIINSTGTYGQLSVTSVTGSMAFGIYNTSTLSAYRYLNVLQGFSSLSGITGTTGTYGGYSYSLVADATLANSWDLLVYLAGPSVADTQVSLANTASALQNIYTLQNSVLANSFTYDCTLFDKNNVCISAGGRNTAVSAANGLNNTSGLLIAAYRPHPNYRIGAYADQNLSVNNAGSTVNLGNNTPLIGLFGAWNERLDGTGTEVKVSAAYGQKNTTINRQVVGTSEAGSGGSQLNSQGAQVTAKYGFAVMPDVVVSPYAGMRYTQNNMGGYTESTTSAVTAPLTYSALNINATTALAGVGASYAGIPQTNLFASAGVETDTNTQNGSVNATGVAGLTPVNFNANPVRTRPTAMVGATYDVAKNQRLGVTGIYRQEAYQAVQTTTVMATYMVGL